MFELLWHLIHNSSFDPVLQLSKRGRGLLAVLSPLCLYRRLFKLSATVQVAVLDGFGYVCGADVFGFFQVEQHCVPKLDLLICDEWGYVPVSRDGAQLLFQVVSACYEKRSMAITTNLEFGRWVNIFLDQTMTTALIDRLVHHSHLLIFDGESHRVRNSLMRR